MYFIFPHYVIASCRSFQHLRLEVQMRNLIWSKSQTENLFIPRDKTDEHVKLNNIKITRDSKEIPC